VDFLRLTKNSAFSKINELLEHHKKVICDLYDKDGMIDDEIVKTDYNNDLDDEKCVLKLKHGDVVTLEDKYLYNIIYDIKHDVYLLTSHDEYYEKLTVENED
jgi:hypothetical protein